MGCCGYLIPPDNPEEVLFCIGCGMTEVDSEVVHELLDKIGYKKVDLGHIISNPLTVEEYYNHLLKKAREFLDNHDFEKCESVVVSLQELKKHLDSGEFTLKDRVLIEIIC